MVVTWVGSISAPPDTLGDTVTLWSTGGFAVTVTHTGVLSRSVAGSPLMRGFTLRYWQYCWPAVALFGIVKVLLQVSLSPGSPLASYGWVTDEPTVPLVFTPVFPQRTVLVTSVDLKAPVFVEVCVNLTVPPLICEVGCTLEVGWMFQRQSIAP